MPELSVEAIKGRPVAVLGGGVLGRRIACTWAAAGYTVHIRDPSLEQRNSAIHYVEQNVASYARTISSSKPGKATAFEDLEAAVKDAWTVIEAVPEKLQLKIDTFAELARLTKKDCLLASNSSSYKSGEMLEKVDEDTKRRIFNVHYMMPPDNRVVELMTDGFTDEAVIPFYIERLKECGMSPIVARKESTGFVLNRIWAAIKRECLTVLSEGVSTPEELDRVWVEMFSGGKAGPCAMMDAVGLDTVAFIEQHYVKERGLPTKDTVDFLQSNYIDKGALGGKSGKGGLYPAGYTTKSSGEESSHHDNLHSPTLYYLDLGMNATEDIMHAGKIVAQSASGKEPKTLVSDLTLPDGLDISVKDNRIYWTNMGIPSENDGSIQSCKLDGSDVREVVKRGDVHTPKQLIVDQQNNKLYFCDREGLRVMRCNLDGSEQETLVQRGDWKVKEETQDSLRWCVGISVNNQRGYFYWTQKGASKAGKGRIYRAKLEMPSGETAATRSDIEVVLTGLPEPIDLEIDEEAGKLFWTDRGDPPMGNTINSIDLSDLTHVEDASDNPRYNVLARNMHEAIGIKLDKRNQHIYATDMGGFVYRFDMDGQNKKRIVDAEDRAFSGITLAHV
ncbi:3-hydroxyacyl-CoA dehydrogenase-like protein [Aureobasidium sp. EXF-10728]|nr:3-hydroxyacyl-CoA dehydrogenase-like protein [Aureobasidium sp. EXF-10728]